MIWAHYFEPKS